jgi:CHAT domain-containing protein
LYGGVHYDIDSVTMRKSATLLPYNDVAVRAVPACFNEAGLSAFNYLYGSANEVKGINKLARQWNYDIIVAEGIKATEESFKWLSGANSPAVLHIASHGFFFPDPQNQKVDENTGGAIILKQSGNPLIRSGLALAGANNAWKGKPVAGIEDGILTAYEVSNMYLPNTRLAVLSACETGLGDIQGSEGVYGLQRAFKIAGVENLVMSLWKVPDAETAEFMQQLYKNLFSKQTIQDAFYNAQTTMKNKYRNDPYKWAAWVLIR